MKNVVNSNYRWVFALLIGLAIPIFEMSLDSQPGKANLPDEDEMIEPAASAQPSQTFTVTSTSDGTGAGTLRTAITSANANPGLDTIAFNIAGSGVRTITLTSSLPAITDPVIIDGSTQPLYTGTPLIRLAASGSGVTSVINITGGGSTVRALTFNFFSGVTDGNGVINLASNNNVVAACAGGVANTQVVINGGANNRIGGSIPADRNYFYGITSGNEIVIVKGATATGNRIVGNWFGTGTDGSRFTNAGKNILIDNAPNNFIGGSAGTTPDGACTGECNIISGSDDEAILISGAAATGNTVIGNFIGLAADGSNTNRNGSVGIHINNAANNHIGGSTPGERNVMAANFFGDIFVEGTSAGTTITGNYVGLKSSGTQAITGTFNVPNFGIELNANNIRVGGVTAGERNIISGSNRGLIVNGGSNLVQGNFIGTDVTGNVALTTLFDGVVVNGANNTIGGTDGTTLGGACTGACNLISGNGRNGLNNGLVISGTSATGNVVDGNYIGLNAAGTAAIRNGTPPNGRAILVFNANNNIIGRVSTGSSRPETTFQTHTDYCIQDDIDGSFITFNTATGVFHGEDCLTGAKLDPPPNGTVESFLSGMEFKAAPKLNAFLNGGDFKGSGSLFEGPFSIGYINDSDIRNNGSCKCPDKGSQFLVGKMEFGGDQGSNGNTAGNNFSGVSPTLSTDFSLTGDIGYWVTTGAGNIFLNDFSTTRDMPNMIATPGTVITGGDYFNNGGIPISDGDQQFPDLVAQKFDNGNINLSGTMTGVPNTTYTIDIFDIGFYDFVNQTLGASRFTGVKFEVTTGATGTVSINQNITDSDALIIRYSDKIAFTSTTETEQQMRPEDPSFPTVKVPVRTSEMSPPIHVPGFVVSGRVTAPDGRGLRNASVSIIDTSTGIRRTTTTSSFGFFSFEDVAARRSYTITVSSRLYRFAPRTENVFDDLSNVNLVGLE